MHKKDNKINLDTAYLIKIYAVNLVKILVNWLLYLILT